MSKKKIIIQCSLFGDDIAAHKIKNTSKMSDYQRFKIRNNYKKSDDKHKRCDNCKYIHRKRFHNKNYYKCLLIGCSNGSATDIRLSYVCDKHEEE